MMFRESPCDTEQKRKTLSRRVSPTEKRAYTRRVRTMKLSRCRLPRRNVLSKKPLIIKPFVAWKRFCISAISLSVVRAHWNQTLRSFCLWTLCVSFISKQWNSPIREEESTMKQLANNASYDGACASMILHTFHMSRKHSSTICISLIDALWRDSPGELLDYSFN